MAADKTSRNKIKTTKKITKKPVKTKKKLTKVSKKEAHGITATKKVAINKKKVNLKHKTSSKKAKPASAKLKKSSKLTKKPSLVKKISKPKTKPTIKHLENKKSSAVLTVKPLSQEKISFPETYTVIDEHSNYNQKHTTDLTLNLNTGGVLQGPSKFEPYHIHSNEEYMNEQQLKHFASILEAWKQDLMLEVDNTITEMKEADVLADLNDRATQEETFNLELRARDRERKLIKKIEAALKKISNQEYGYCESCGVEIGIRRLEARPTATLCIECKTLAEIREKRI